MFSEYKVSSESNSPKSLVINNESGNVYYNGINGKSFLNVVNFMNWYGETFQEEPEIEPVQVKG